MLLLFFQVPTSFRFFSEDSTHHDTSCVIILCYYDKCFLNNCFKSLPFSFLLQVFYLFFSKCSPIIFHTFLNSFWWVAFGLKAEVSIACAMPSSGDKLGISFAWVGCKDLERKNKWPLFLINSVEWYVSFNSFASFVGNFVFSVVKPCKLTWILDETIQSSGFLL